MLKRLLALLALATAVGLAACSPAATSNPTLTLGTPAASELPTSSESTAPLTSP
jgi:hypothetical protein